MKAPYTTGIVAIIAACSSTPEVAPETQAIRDYIEVGELREADRIRTYNRDSWTILSDYFVIYKARNDEYLIGFKRACRELHDLTRVTPDVRHDHDTMRAGEDTLRGCRIDKMYPLTGAQAIELRHLGNAPRAGN